MNTLQLNRLASFAALVVASAVFTVSASAQRTKPVTRGDWGGSEVAMSVTENGATIQFDCANGTITKKLGTKRDGTFTAEGTYMRNGPGPIRVGQEGLAVTFKGKVTGQVMKLTMTDVKTGEILGDYTVTKGQSTRLHRCY
jgi:hypothetical protein